MTRGGEIGHTLRGIEAAVRSGLTPVKINVVAQRHSTMVTLQPHAMDQAGSGGSWPVVR